MRLRCSFHRPSNRSVLHAHDGMAIFFSFGQSFRQWNKRVLMSDHETHSTIINELNRAKKNKCCWEFRQTNKQTKMVSKECVSLEHSTWRLPNESWKCLCCRPRDWHKHRILWSCNHSVQISLSTVCAISLKFLSCISVWFEWWSMPQNN